jgi:glycosyltransferase involved in cell wall biosynthesis
LDKVTFWGVRSDIPEILSCMNGFVLPSLWEGLGIVSIEAQFMGLPVFASERIPREADLGGLITISLEKGAANWAKKIYNYLNGDENYTIDVDKMKKYDPSYLIDEVERIYSNI